MDVNGRLRRGVLMDSDVQTDKIKMKITWIAADNGHDCYEYTPKLT